MTSPCYRNQAPGPTGDSFNHHRQVLNTPARPSSMGQGRTAQSVDVQSGTPEADLNSRLRSPTRQILGVLPCQAWHIFLRATLRHQKTSPEAWNDTPSVQHQTKLEQSPTCFTNSMSKGECSRHKNLLRLTPQFLIFSLFFLFYYFFFFSSF